MWTIFVLRRRRAGDGDNDVDAAVQPDEGDADVDYETPCQPRLLFRLTRYSTHEAEGHWSTRIVSFKIGTQKCRQLGVKLSENASYVLLSPMFLFWL